MSQVALTLDERERKLMAESGFASADYLKYMQVSQNSTKFFKA
jgi:hypothetical protein